MTHHSNHNHHQNHHQNYYGKEERKVSAGGAYHVPMPARVYSQSPTDWHHNQPGHRKKHKRGCVEKLKMAFYMGAIVFLVLLLVAIMIGFVFMLLDPNKPLRRSLFHGWHSSSDSSGSNGMKVNSDDATSGS